MKQSNSVETLGIDHVGLTVSHLDETVEFFTNTLGWNVIGELPEYPAKFISNGQTKLTLWAAENSFEAVKFDRKNNIGLHHLAIGVPSFDELDKLYDKLKKLSNIDIEFAPELSGKGPHKHMMIREPSGIRIEFVHRPA
ncbi:VOC family protein [Aliikangiella sp. IMCC44359]|uniref:VOC family protein n=1 Tax=Aliikangiella sp. IMCC44359 TaxID=3459125 RepID=UPI00403B26C9